MFSTLAIVLFIVGLAIILALAFWAVKLLSALKIQKQKQAAILAKQEEALKQHDSKVFTSISIIIKAMLEEQCDYSEGCWRLCVLFDSLKTQNNFASQFPQIYAFYDGIKHLSILDARKKLTKSERMKEDFQRLKIESEITPKVKIELPSILRYTEKQLQAFSITVH